MADTPDGTKPGETGGTQPLQNNGNPQGTPAPQQPAQPVKTEDPSAIEQLRKELEQARMRANQLENEKKQREEEEAKRQAEELEKNNQYKELYEQEKTQREAIESERAEAERKQELEKTKSEVLNGYSDEVKTLAEEVGLSLTDTDEQSVNTFKEKLDKLNTRVGNTKVTPNNGNRNSNEPEPSADDLKVLLADENNFHDYMVKKYPGIASMTSPRKV